MKRLEGPLKSPKYPLGVTVMMNVLLKCPKGPKYPKNHKMSKKTPPNLLIDQNRLKISKTTKST